MLKQITDNRDTTALKQTLALTRFLWILQLCTQQHWRVNRFKEGLVETRMALTSQELCISFLFPFLEKLSMRPVYTPIKVGLISLHKSRRGVQNTHTKYNISGLPLQKIEQHTFRGGCERLWRDNSHWILNLKCIWEDLLCLLGGVVGVTVLVIHTVSRALRVITRKLSHNFVFSSAWWGNTAKSACSQSVASRAVLRPRHTDVVYTKTSQGKRWFARTC